MAREMEVVRIGLPVELEGVQGALQHEAEEALRDNLEGITPRLPVITIQRGQRPSFVFPNGDTAKDFTGVIVDHHKVNAFWEGGAEAGIGGPPDCLSPDGIRSTEGKLCATCGRNRFGDDGRKECKNMIRLAILLPGDIIPHRLTLPPTSIAPVERYLTALTARRLPACAVLTKFGLEKATTRGGWEVARITLSMEEILDPQILQQVLGIRKFLKEISRAQVFQPTEELGEEMEETDVPF